VKQRRLGLGSERGLEDFHRLGDLGKRLCRSSAAWSVNTSVAMNESGSAMSRPMSKLTVPSIARLGATTSCSAPNTCSL
jgi:hypothetical protein